MRRFRVRRAFVVPMLVALAVMIGAVAGIVSGRGPSIEITHMNDKEIDKKAVTDVGGGWVTLPQTEYLSGDFEWDLERRLVNTAVMDVDKLKTWQLCGAELRAEATARQAVADAQVKYPRNLPHNWEQTPQEVAHRNKFVNELQEGAAQFNRAADLADKAKIPCFTGSPSADARFVTLTEGALGGRLGGSRLKVPDYAVMDMLQPVEYYRHMRKCVSELETNLAEVSAAPIDKKVDSKAPWTTFSQRSKATSIADYQASIAMLRATGVNC